MNIRKTVLSVALTSVLTSTIIAGQTFADTSVGAYVNNDGWSTANIDAFNIDTARQAATINIFSSFDSNWNEHLQHQAGNVVSRGATPLITWMPYNRATPDANILEEIIDGKQDAYVDSWLADFKSWLSSYPADQQPKIALRFSHEFNGTWYPWGNKPDAMKAAWRYLHNKFAEAGVSDSVDWVWCANNVDVDSFNDITRYYPGDDVVDWVSIDGYNWGSNYSFSDWKSFDQTFSQMYVKMIESFPTKPIMLAEVSTAEPHDVPDPAKGQDGTDSDAAESKELWISDMMARVKESYPAIKSIVWFNTNKELGWAINLEGNTGLTAFNNAVSDDYFAGTLDLSAATQSVQVTQKSANVVSSKGKTKGRQAVNDNASSIAKTKRPEVVGRQALAREARGLRKMNKQALRKRRLESVLPK